MSQQQQFCTFNSQDITPIKSPQFEYYPNWSQCKQTPIKNNGLYYQSRNLSKDQDSNRQAKKYGSNQQVSANLFFNTEHENKKYGDLQFHQKMNQKQINTTPFERQEYSTEIRKIQESIIIHNFENMPIILPDEKNVKLKQFKPLKTKDLHRSTLKYQVNIANNELFNLRAFANSMFNLILNKSYDQNKFREDRQKVDKIVNSLFNKNYCQRSLKYSNLEFYQDLPEQIEGFLAKIKNIANEFEQLNQNIKRSAKKKQRSIQESQQKKTQKKNWKINSETSQFELEKRISFQSKMNSIKNIFKKGTKLSDNQSNKNCSSNQFSMISKSKKVKYFHKENNSNKKDQSLKSSRITQNETNLRLQIEKLKEQCIKVRQQIKQMQIQKQSIEQKNEKNQLENMKLKQEIEKVCTITQILKQKQKQLIQLKLLKQQLQNELTNNQKDVQDWVNKLALLSKYHQQQKNQLEAQINNISSEYNKICSEFNFKNQQYQKFKKNYIELQNQYDQITQDFEKMLTSKDQIIKNLSIELKNLAEKNKILNQNSSKKEQFQLKIQQLIAIIHQNQIKFNQILGQRANLINEKQQLIKQVQNLNKNNYTYHNHNMALQIQIQRDIIKKLNQQKSIIYNELCNYKENIQINLKQRIKCLEQQINKLSQIIRLQSFRKAQYQKDLQNQNIRLSKQLENYKSQNQDLNNQRNIINHSDKFFQSEIQRLLKEINIYKTQASDFQVKINSLQIQIKKLSQKNLQIQIKIESMQQQKFNMFDNTMSQKQVLVNQKSQLKTENVAIGQQICIVKDKIIREQSMLKQNELSHEKAKLENQICNKNLEINSLKEYLSNITQDFNNQIQQMNNHLNQYQIYSTSIKSELQNKKIQINNLQIQIDKNNAFIRNITQLKQITQNQYKNLQIEYKQQITALIQQNENLKLKAMEYSKQINTLTAQKYGNNINAQITQQKYNLHFKNNKEIQQRNILDNFKEQNMKLSIQIDKQHTQINQLNHKLIEISSLVNQLDSFNKKYIDQIQVLNTKLSLYQYQNSSKIQQAIQQFHKQQNIPFQNYIYTLYSDKLVSQNLISNLININLQIQQRFDQIAKRECKIPAFEIQRQVYRNIKLQTSILIKQLRQELQEIKNQNLKRDQEYLNLKEKQTQNKNYINQLIDIINKTNVKILNYQNDIRSLNTIILQQNQQKQTIIKIMTQTSNLRTQLKQHENAIKILEPEVKKSTNQFKIIIDTQANYIDFLKKEIAQIKQNRSYLKDLKKSNSVQHKLIRKKTTESRKMSVEVPSNIQKSIIEQDEKIYKKDTIQENENLKMEQEDQEQKKQNSQISKILPSRIKQRSIQKDTVKNQDIFIQKQQENLYDLNTLLNIIQNQKIQLNQLRIKINNRQYTNNKISYRINQSKKSSNFKIQSNYKSQNLEDIKFSKLKSILQFIGAKKLSNNIELLLQYIPNILDDNQIKYLLKETDQIFNNNMNIEYSKVILKIRKSEQIKKIFATHIAHFRTIKSQIDNDFQNAKNFTVINDSQHEARIHLQNIFDKYYKNHTDLSRQILKFLNRNLKLINEDTICHIDELIKNINIIESNIDTIIKQKDATIHEYISKMAYFFQQNESSIEKSTIKELFVDKQKIKNNQNDIKQQIGQRILDHDISEQIKKVELEEINQEKFL